MNLGERCNLASEIRRLVLDLDDEGVGGVLLGRTIWRNV
ncbi:hypothetical protein CGCF415_v006378 [Colletotrichum fructicola]|nr:uncharacterized protein CGCA056_v010842 [Colletotrichum aenigma]KAF4896069.1 hypothetical protein CGCFRS4_v005682 [Colletotrichum fructicola]KAF4908780.1 hypothetical protein CGCF415_v006378 [Colletotrichum fructicola]KAF4937260.1 hypothetical protein CGCF245_v005822 [Colletotrichum fructicola]KAF5517786.1 hypothetical protein CGCA056_v010842 [Colletotrichum aenigma]